LIPITATVTATITVTVKVAAAVSGGRYVSVYVQGTVTVNQVAFAISVSVARLLYVHSKPRLAAAPRLRVFLPVVVILTPPLLPLLLLLLLLLLLRTLLPPLLPSMVILLLHLGRLPSLVINRPTWARTRATARAALRLLPSRGRRRRRNGDLAPACACGSGRLRTAVDAALYGHLPTTLPARFPALLGFEGASPSVNPCSCMMDGGWSGGGVATTERERRRHGVARPAPASSLSSSSSSSSSKLTPNATAAFSPVGVTSSVAIHDRRRPPHSSLCTAAASVVAQE
jgi:hypothetical protein